MGFIAMKALSGGLVGNVPAAFAFIRQYDNVVPIFGIQHEWELDEFIALDANPPKMDDEMRAVIAERIEKSWLENFAALADTACRARRASIFRRRVAYIYWRRGLPISSF